jgi:hypothetical protein
MLPPSRRFFTTATAEATSRTLHATGSRLSQLPRKSRGLATPAPSATVPAWERIPVLQSPTPGGIKLTNPARRLSPSAHSLLPCSPHRQDQGAWPLLLHLRLAAKGILMPSWDLSTTQTSGLDLKAGTGHPQPWASLKVPRPVGCITMSTMKANPG